MLKSFPDRYVFVNDKAYYYSIATLYDTILNRLKIGRVAERFCRSCRVFRLTSSWLGWVSCQLQFACFSCGSIYGGFCKAFYPLACPQISDYKTSLSGREEKAN
jgi:hypothetical protein